MPSIADIDRRQRQRDENEELFTFSIANFLRMPFSDQISRERLNYLRHL